MRDRLRTLERRLVLERTQIAVGQAVDELLLRWDTALCHDSSPPEAIQFPATLVDAGFYLPTCLRAVQYLERCGRRKTLPDRDRLLRILLPQGNAPSAS